ncbi:MAG: hypothetical protein H7A32_03635 [Deltaproteobacteria bacterium]|nr:hypothetical protein [Deltaproteobacteria bacterium]
MNLSSQHSRAREAVSKKKSMALGLNILVWPGAGQLYLNKKGKGYFFIGAELLLVGGTFIRFMSVMFYLLNVRSYSLDLNVWTLMGETWQSDQEVLFVMLVGIFLVWLLAVLDVWVSFRES